jgi:hypothetical protein
MFTLAFQGVGLLTSFSSSRCASFACYGSQKRVRDVIFFLLFAVIDGTINWCCIVAMCPPLQCQHVCNLFIVPQQRSEFECIPGIRVALPTLVQN